MTTKRLFPEPQNERPLPAKVTLPTTHVLETPQRTRRMEMHLPPEYVPMFLAAGWHIVEDRTATK